MKLWREDAGVISEDPIWVIAGKGYLYTGSSMLQVIRLYIHEYKHDRHLVG